MREPDWVYRQRRQRAAAVLVMVIGAIVTIGVLGSTVGGGFDPELPVEIDETKRVAIDRPDTDQILARERQQVEATKERKRERRARRAQREVERKRGKRERREDRRELAPDDGAPATQPAADGSAPAPAPSPSPEPPAAPEPEPAPAPAPPPTPAPSSGPVDPRFY